MQEQATPLHVAAYQGHLGVVKLLMAHKANVDALDKVHYKNYDNFSASNSILSLIFS